MTSQQVLALQPGDRIITTEPMQNQVMSYVKYEDKDENFPIGTIFEITEHSTTSTISCKIVINDKLEPTMAGSYLIHSYYFPRIELLAPTTAVTCDSFVY